jgi:hypothetical protein
VVVLLDEEEEGGLNRRMDEAELQPPSVRRILRSFSCVCAYVCNVGHLVWSSATINDR